VKMTIDCAPSGATWQESYIFFMALSDKPLRTAKRRPPHAVTSKTSLSSRGTLTAVSLLLLLLLVVSTSCERRPEDARRELASLGVTWSIQNFIESVENRDKVVVTLYLEAGMSPDSTSDFGWTALMHAALEAGSYELMQQLLAAGADVNAQDPVGMTALAIAAGQGHPRNVDLLLGSDAAVDARDTDGWTALMYAAQVGNEAIVRSLIAAGANVDVANTDGDTPLSLAREGGYEKVVKLLTGSGASLAPIRQ